MSWGESGAEPRSVTELCYWLDVTPESIEFFLLSRLKRKDGVSGDEREEEPARARGMRVVFQ